MCPPSHKALVCPSSTLRSFPSSPSKLTSVFRRLVDKSKYLHWLDFFDQLLDDTGASLREDFRLDGTHLAPGYVSLLEKALGDAWVEGVPAGKRGSKTK